MTMFFVCCLPLQALANIAHVQAFRLSDLFHFEHLHLQQQAGCFVIFKHLYGCFTSQYHGLSYYIQNHALSIMDTCIL